MSTFTGTVSHVGNTRIFARAAGNGNQFLVYQMEYSAGNDLAMILPLPTPPDTTADQVRFINMSGYHEFFSAMENGFPLTRNMPYTTMQPKRLMTQQVGSYQVSFVPSVAELSKLEDKFRLPESVWKSLPEYNEFGFAVFKLRAGTNTVHPLALEFPMRNPQLLFFPTTHIRDGQVAEEAVFDHDLFCQAKAGWLRSYDVAGAFMDMDRTEGIVDPNERISRMTVQGMHPNSDILVGLRA